jgi:acyl-CoA reductase-like NAD-dependent aldehyde dehydrogenase
VTPYQPAAWHDLFVAVAGAAAALTGLIFVAVSRASRGGPAAGRQRLDQLLGQRLLGLSYGGYKMSGRGGEMGFAGMEALAQEESVWVSPR